MSEIKEEGQKHKPGSAKSVQAKIQNIDKGTFNSNDDREGVIGEKPKE